MEEIVEAKELEANQKTENLDQKENKKIVVFVRHGHSQANKHTENVKGLFRRIRNFHFPTWEQWSSFSPTSLNFDSLLTEKGKQQVSTLRDLLHENNFWENYNFDLVVHSPLIRARDTCKGILESNNNRIDSFPVLEKIELKEFTMFDSTEKKKNQLFLWESWLKEREEKVILVVGHSLHFRELFGREKEKQDSDEKESEKQKLKINNCDVWVGEVTFHNENKIKNNNLCVWSEPKLLFRVSENAK